MTGFDTDDPVYHSIDVLGVGRRPDGGVMAGGWKHVEGYDWTAFNLLAYICAANADINTVYTPSKPVKGRKPNKAKDRKRSMCTVHQVGYHIGAKLRAYERRMASADAVDADSDGEKRNVRPHMRRAHWHHYWTGPRDVPEERRLVIKWVAPTFVNASKGGVDAPTIHKVR